MCPDSSSANGLLVVCAVVVDPEKRILATQRGPDQSLSGYWEFPGGKVEPGEDFEVALRRELREELELELDDFEPLDSVTHSYEFGTITLLPFLSRCEIHPTLRLLEHAAHRWISLEEADSLNWAPADLPILDNLARRL